MFRRKKNTETTNAAFTEIEEKLKARIHEIQKLHDPAEQLLQYKALKKSTHGAFDPANIRESKEIVVDKSTRKGLWVGGAAGVTGFWGGFFGGMGFIIAGAALTGGIAIIAGSAAVVGGTAAGYGIGRKNGLKKYNKYTPEEKHATQMHGLVHDIERSIERLVNDYTNSDYKEAKLKALETSPAREQVLKEFPRITSAFNDYAARKADAPADRAPFVKPPSFAL